MENITLGQIAVGVAFIVALIKGFKYLADTITSSVKEIVEKEVSDLKTDLEEVHKDIKEIREDNTMLKNTTYTILSHLATNNNTKEMRKALDKYVENAMKD